MRINIFDKNPIARICVMIGGFAIRARKVEQANK
jgi:hypothetical protein